MRLPASLKAAVAEISKADGTSINQFVATAVAEKVSALRTAEFFTGRAAQADVEAARRLRDRLARPRPEPAAVRSLTLSASTGRPDVRSVRRTQPLPPPAVRTRPVRIRSRRWTGAFAAEAAAEVPEGDAAASAAAEPDPTGAAGDDAFAALEQAFAAEVAAGELATPSSSRVEPGTGSGRHGCVLAGFQELACLEP